MTHPGRCFFVLSLLVGSLGILTDAKGRGGLGAEHPWAADHIRELPQDIRRNLTPQEQACGGSRAQHSFARYLSLTGGAPAFVALHFDLFDCADRTRICTLAGCLHQVYSATGQGYRLVFSSYVEELELKILNGAAAIEISCSGRGPCAGRTLRWNGLRFIDTTPGR